MRKVKVIYWTTSCFEAEIEAISKEIFTLANHFRPSFIFGVNQHYILKFSLKNRYIGFNPKFYPFLRFLVPILERWADINHVYGEVSPWLYHKALRRKRTVLTIASEKGSPLKDFLDRCSAIVVQTQKMEKDLIGMGIKKNKIHLVYPGVDLQKFKPADSTTPPLGKPKVLFATAPRTQEELRSRGINFLISVAKLNPDISFHFLYRPWENQYTSIEATKYLIKKYHLKNVILSNEAIKDMSEIYRAHHFTIIPYISQDGGKECPNSLVESLACGVPILISNVASFSKFIKNNGCGAIFPLNKNKFRYILMEALKNYDSLISNAKKVSSFFSLEKTISNYREIYSKIS